MDLPLGDKGPAILQLHKWGPSQAQLNLSEFREAFISPTRQILLLLSYQYEALLIPLVTGSNVFESSSDGSLPSPETEPDRSASNRDDMPCRSGSVEDFESDMSFGADSSRCKSYPFLGDVNSLAWGVCEDAYNQHKDALFTELLFVCGKQGVMVHAFVESTGDTAITGKSLEGGYGQGKWVEWGPSASLLETVEVEEPTRLSCETTGNTDFNRANGINENPHIWNGNDELPKTVASKRWLQSFLTKVENVEYNCNVSTRFPEKSLIPCSAKVVSFSLFNSSLPILDFLSNSDSTSNKGCCEENVHESESDISNFKSETLSNIFGVGVDSLYKCFRVFSSNSHYFIGFVFSQVDPVIVNTSVECEKCKKNNVLLIARLENSGIHWISSVKLDESPNIGSVEEWTDFHFSDNLLVCLNARGLIMFYAAMTGEYVAHVDILQTLRLNPQMDLHKKEERSTVYDKHIDYSGRRVFKRLVSASHTSLVAAVDDCGVIYVISSGEYLPDKYYTNEKLLPHIQHLGLGMLAGWEVGGSDIGYQRENADISGLWNFIPSIRTGRSLLDDCREKALQRNQNFYLKREGSGSLCVSGFAASSKEIDQKFDDSERKSHLMRKIFLSSYKFSDEDTICFSPLGITRLIKNHSLNDDRGCQIVHLNLHGDSAVCDDSVLNAGCEKFYSQVKEESFIGEAVGCTFQGCFYLVTEAGLSILLPSISTSSHFLPVEVIGCGQLCTNSGIECEVENRRETPVSKQPWSEWIIEILDRVLLYESAEEADRLCLENGWDLKISRMRRLQLSLDYLKFDEIERSLEKLVGVNLAEEGVLRLLFVTVYLMLRKVGNDNDVSAASRLLALATCFATKMIRKYWLLEHRKNAYESGRTQILSLPPVIPVKVEDEMANSRRLREMAHFLEIIRNLQSRLGSKYKRPGQEMVDIAEASRLVDADLLQNESQLSIVSVGSISVEASKQQEVSFPVSASSFSYTENLALPPVDSKAPLDTQDLSEVSALVPQGEVLEKKILPLENPQEMIARWKIDNLDLKAVVNDALLAGRLPLAVLQLHLHRSRDSYSGKEPHDAFTEVRDIGRAIAYDLFLKGESGLAVATLHRLGEDVEASLKQLLFGTVRRSLRVKITEEMNKYGYLRSYEWKILDRISLIERLYPSSSFWKTLYGRQKEFMRTPASSSLPKRYYLRLLDSHIFNNFVIECDEIDGVVFGSWANVNESPSVPVVDDDNAHVGYWAAAAVWFSFYDQRSVDRIVLDQSSFMGVHVLWESQLEYHVCHNDWEEVSRLLDLIPQHIVVVGSLQVNLDGLQPSSTFECNRGSEYGDYLCSVEELDSVCMDVPGIQIFRFSCNVMCSIWLRMLMEEKLAKKLIFLKEYWEGTADILPLLARSGFITSKYEKLSEDDNIEDISVLKFPDGATVQALQKLLIHHCAQYNLPYLLDLYLDQHELVPDSDSLQSLQEAAGDCEWARWLLLSRVKGCEFEASFSNSRAILLRNLVPDSNLSIPETDEIIRTVDDIAEGGGELAALATLMYASVPFQSCLCSGSVKRHSGTSAQCTLENLRPTLQRFPTLWHTFVSACFGQDITSNLTGPKAKNDLSDYLNWRDDIFFSSGRDTSLLQMLPYWFPKSVRRLIQLYAQGPLGWQSISGLPVGEGMLHRDTDFVINTDDNVEISALSWEATIQKHIEEELYNSALEENTLGLEHHLHRGRALAAFNHFLGVRVRKFKSEGQAHVQTNVQADVQTLLGPITESEQSLLSSVMPLAIIHFEDSVLVASCAFLLELLGFSASMLRIDIAALKRVSYFYKSSENSENLRKISTKGSAFHAVGHESDIMESLARVLADEYLHPDSASMAKQKGTPSLASRKQPSRALMLFLEHLEKASLPPMVDERTCGSWLLSGNGDGIDLRSQQKAASHHWNLVTIFCQMHHLPLSTRYLSVLARDNDWVGFLSEAQIGGYPFDTVTHVASKDFSDPRLKIHISTVLKGMQSRRKATSSTNAENAEQRSEASFADESICVPVELFRILAECEKKKNPGKAILMKAKELSWSILAMIASCFSDVSPISCLTVWLEITAARETSSIKVNDIASRIANNVGAAVEATNSLPADGSKTLIFHYNRKNSKRRRLLEPISEDHSAASVSEISSSSAGAKIFDSQGIFSEGERNIELGENINVSSESVEGSVSLSKMVSVLCEQHLFLPLLRAFEMFLPSCSLVPFIRALQAFSQMRVSEASAHLGSFSARIKEESTRLHANVGRDMQIGASWISSTAIKAADAMLLTCPSPYEKRCLLKLLAATDFGDGGSAATCYRQLYWKINLAEPLLREDDILPLGDESLDDASLATALEDNRHWEQARNWARQLEANGGVWKSAVHHVTETQAESMVAEWKEFLWDVPEERIALWGHCQTLFIRYSFPALQAGVFFLKHAEALEKDLPARELHELLLLSLQWLSGMITLSNPVYPLHLIREIETKVWLLAVESEAQVKSEGDFNFSTSIRDPIPKSSSSIIDRTAGIITKMDNHIGTFKNRTIEKHDARESSQAYNKNQVLDVSFPTTTTGSTKTKRRAKGYVPLRRQVADSSTEPDDGSISLNTRYELQMQDENSKMETSFSRWEERVGPVELERAVLSLLEFGQIAAAKQLQHKLSPVKLPSEFVLVDAAMKLAAISIPSKKVFIEMLDEEVCSVIQSYNIPIDQHQVDTVQVLESLANIFTEGSGRGLCKRIIAVHKAASMLGLSFSEAFDKQPIELLQLLSLKAQESFEEASLLVRTHSMPAASIAQILSESFLKGLLAAHRGGYMDSQKEEGPAPLLWRFSDFLKWAELCPSEQEIGHALMRLVITGQEVPHACEVELLILSHHFYRSSSCLDGVDVLVALAATRVEAYVSEGDFSCLARLITGVGNFYALNFILGILIENGQLDLLLQKYSAAADTNAATAKAIRGFRMAVLTSLKHFNPNDLDAFAMVYNHFDMKHETAALLESRAEQSSEQWFSRYDKDQNEDLLDSMRYYIEAAEVLKSMDAGNKTRRACAQASLLSLQIRMPDFHWLHRSETNARRALVEQSRFQEALIVAEAYGLNQPSEWALVLWNQMLKPEVLEDFVAEFVAVLPLQPSMLTDLSRFYRAEVAARGDQSQFSVWLTGGGLPAEWAKYLGRSFRCLLKRTRDLKLRLQLATVATGFGDVIDACTKALDRVPENVGPLVLRKGHGGAYLPLM